MDTDIYISSTTLKRLSHSKLENNSYSYIILMRIYNDLNKYYISILWLNIVLLHILESTQNEHIWNVSLEYSTSLWYSFTWNGQICYAVDMRP